MLEIELFLTDDGTAPFTNWFEGLSGDVADRVRVALLRFGQCNLGDSKRTQSKDIKAAQLLWKRYKALRRRQPWR